MIIKNWIDIKVGDNILISNVEFGITLFSIKSILETNNSSIIVGLSSLSDSRDFNVLASKKESVYFVN